MKDKSLTVQELREKLVKAGYDANEVTSMGKKQLRDLLDTLEAAEAVLDKAIVTDESIVPTDGTQEKSVTASEPVGPKPTDKGWTDFVLGHFEPYELDNGNPKADGLRRVAELLLGPFNIRTNVVQAPALEQSATVIVTLEFFTGRIVDGAADVSSANTARDYAVHAVATAETRAEGRALRKALRLTKVLTAEELQSADADEAKGMDGRIPLSMINSLKAMCQKQNVDLERLAQKEFQVNSLEDLSPAQGRRIAGILGEIHRGEKELTDDLKSI